MTTGSWCCCPVWSGSRPGSMRGPCGLTWSCCGRRGSWSCERGAPRGVPRGNTRGVPELRRGAERG